MEGEPDSSIKCGVASGSSADNLQHLDTSWYNKNELILKVYMTFPDTRLQPADLRLLAMAVNWIIVKIFKSRLSLIVRVNLVLNRTVVVDSG